MGKKQVSVGQDYADAVGLVANDEIVSDAAPLPVKQTSARSNRSVSGEVSVPSNAWTTVVEYTPAADATVRAFNADFSAILTATYRLRLITGTDAAPTVLVQEVLTTTANSFFSWKHDVPAGTRVAVQLLHVEAVAQTARASINYEE